MGERAVSCCFASMLGDGNIQYTIDLTRLILMMLFRWNMELVAIGDAVFALKNITDDVIDEAE